MTLAPNAPSTAAPAVPPGSVTVSIDGIAVVVPAGTLIIRAAESIGIQIPRFCDHPLLDPVGACRQCIVEVEGQRKPLTACTTTVTDGMVIRTQLSSPVAAKAQAGTMELLLINHPLDCPICDKGGECPLQNQAMSNGHAESRFHDVKRTYPKPLAISTQVLLDRERCVLCARCTRFSQQIAGDPFIELLERGANQQVGINDEQPFQSYFSGNTIQICPVGALTGAAYRFRARPFDLVSTPGVCEHCASGCAQRNDHRRGKVVRRLAGDDPAVNEEWNCDKGRWAFRYATAEDRLTGPLVRDSDSGQLVPASWPYALSVAAQVLRRAEGQVGVLPGGRLTVEDAHAYSKFARTVLGTDHVDFRARASSADEAQVLTRAVAGRGLQVSYADLESAPAVLCVALDPEEESPIVFLRLRKAVRAGTTRVRAVATFASPGLVKLNAELVLCGPADLVATLGGLALDDATVVLAGERVAAVPGGAAAVAALVARTGARLAWVPRRAGERGALEAGLLPGLRPGGRPAGDPTVAQVWGSDPTAAAPGLDLPGMLGAADSSWAFLVGGVDLDDLPDPAAARTALAAAGGVVSLELRSSSVTALADVVLPVAAPVEKAGSYLTWEGRVRPFTATVTASTMPDARVLHLLAAEMGADLGLPDVTAVARELAVLGASVSGPNGAAGAGTGPATVAGGPAAGQPTGAAAGEGWVLDASHYLLDEGSLQAGEEHLAGTRRAAVARMSAAGAAALGVVDGQVVSVTGPRGTITLPLAVTAMPDGVVWLPLRSPGSAVLSSCGPVGARVQVAKGER